MINGMIGKKLGMGQTFDDSGRAIGVTVVEVGPCFVVRKKGDGTVQVGRDGISAVARIRTVRDLTEFRARSVNAHGLAGFSKARNCREDWAV